MKALILGDVHGCWDDLNVTISKALRDHPDITHIIQCGDFGYGSWGGQKPFKPSKGYLDDEAWEVYHNATRLWLDGNHEDHDQLGRDGGDWQPGWTYMPRGSVLELEDTFDDEGRPLRIMFYGGATSADKVHRVEGVSWWREEAISYAHMRKVLAETEGPIHAIFSHEHPRGIPYSDSRYTEIIGHGDMAALDALREQYKPQWLFFGHHHLEDHGVVEGSEWLCAPIIESRKYIIWDGRDLICSWWNEHQRRFFAKIDRTKNCWFWRGAIGSHGYGNLQVAGKWYRAHRYSYEYFLGKIADGKVLDHSCKNRNCVNPEHLEATTQRINILRGESHIAAQNKQTHCIHGHEFNDVNTYVDKRNRRHCRQCRAKRQLEYKKRKNG
jgi:hypothetical protein